MGVGSSFHRNNGTRWTMGGGSVISQKVKIDMYVGVVWAGAFFLCRSEDKITPIYIASRGCRPPSIRKNSAATVTICTRECCAFNHSSSVENQRPRQVWNNRINK